MTNYQPLLSDLQRAALSFQTSLSKKKPVWAQQLRATEVSFGSNTRATATRVRVGKAIQNFVVKANTDVLALSEDHFQQLVILADGDEDVFVKTFGGYLAAADQFIFSGNELSGIYSSVFADAYYSALENFIGRADYDSDIIAKACDVL